MHRESKFGLADVQKNFYFPRLEDSARANIVRCRRRCWLHRLKAHTNVRERRRRKFTLFFNSQSVIIRYVCGCEVDPGAKGVKASDVT